MPTLFENGPIIYIYRIPKGICVNKIDIDNARGNDKCVNKIDMDNVRGKDKYDVKFNKHNKINLTEYGIKINKFIKIDKRCVKRKYFLMQPSRR